MHEPNPYQPPQTPGPLTTAKVVKRGVGLVVILLLTPVAVVITGGISCAVSAIYMSASVGPNGPTASLNIVLAIFLVPPALVLFGMLSRAVARAIQGRTLPGPDSASNDESSSAARGQT